MDLSSGARVRTHDGLEGFVIAERVHEELHFSRWIGPGSRMKESITAYPVLLDGGEVRFYTEAGLVDPIRRSGALE